mmetsp:Transcript_14052/g.26800  ORF Transcript_14052/g.26800 Transcript_14052/m.26800 type:complete len:80 (+) Transcript_14052:498-737(+)
MKATEKDVWDQFETYGQLVKVTVPKTPGIYGKFGFVNFKKPSDAKRALRELDGSPIKGVKVNLTWARTQPSGNPWWNKK